MRLAGIKKSVYELLWALSDGSKSDMDAWRGSDIFDFFMGLTVHQERVARQLKQLEKNKSKRHGRGST